MKIVLIGLGAWGKNHLRCLKKLNILGGVFETNKRIRFKKEYRDLIFFDSMKQVLEQKNVKAVIISTPANTHYKIAKFFLENKKHVLLEKPMCITYKDSLKLHKISKKNKKILMIGHLLQFHPCVKKIFQLRELVGLNS